MNKIKKIVLILVLMLILPTLINAKETVDLYLFYGDGCPHCAAEEEFLEKMEKEYKNLKINKYEVSKDFSNSSLYNKVRRELEVKGSGVPFTVIGTEYFSGFSSYMESDIEDAIKEASKKQVRDIVGEILGTKEKIEEEDKKEKTNFTLPWLGKVDGKAVSLPIAAIIIGIVDGFNPCAMWILLFLISMLIGMKNKRRMWILGLTFLGTSALVYMLFMLSFFYIIVDVVTTIWIRNVLAVFACSAGLYSLNNYFKSKDSGCNVVNDNKRNKLFKRIKKYITEKSFILSILGIMTIAISVNIIELACSAGLPLIFTQLLAINNVGSIEAFFYTLIYIIFFLIDDIIIFSIAMFTLNITGISTKYSKYSHLIGGILMILIGTLLLFKPEWLMFNF